MSDALRNEICRVGASLHARGYVHASAGNISVRTDTGTLITPTDACLGFLDPAKLARLDADMRQIAGDRVSKTMALHARIYGAATRFDAGTRCVIHIHSTHCVALTLHETPEELLPALTPYFVMKVGHVPVIPYHRPGAPKAGDQVARTIERYGARGTTPIRAVMLQRLGPNVWHDTPAAAMATIEELEETAKLWTMSSRASEGRPEALGPCQIDELRRSHDAPLVRFFFMPRFAANLSMLYPGLDFLDRFEAAANDGFRWELQ